MYFTGLFDSVVDSVQLEPSVSEGFGSSYG